MAWNKVSRRMPAKIEKCISQRKGSFLRIVTLENNAEEKCTDYAEYVRAE